MRVVELGRVGDYSEILGRQICGITHVVLVDGKVVTAVEHHEQNSACLWRSYTDLF